MFSMLFVPKDLFFRSKQALVIFPHIPSWNFFGKIIFSKDGWGANWKSSSFDISLDIRTILNFSQCDKSWLMSSILFCLLLKAIWLDRLVLPLIPPNQSLHTKVHDFCNVLKSTWLQISSLLALRKPCFFSRSLKISRASDQNKIWSHFFFSFSGQLEKIRCCCSWNETWNLWNSCIRRLCYVSEQVN